MEARRRELEEFVFGMFPMLTSRLREQAGRLSGGQRQMLALARAILSDPKQRSGFNQDEVLQMQRIVRGGPIQNLSRGLGNLLGEYRDYRWLKWAEFAVSPA